MPPLGAHAPLSAAASRTPPGLPAAPILLDASHTALQAANKPPGTMQAEAIHGGRWRRSAPTGWAALLVIAQAGMLALLLHTRSDLADARSQLALISMGPGAQAAAAAASGEHRSAASRRLHLDAGAPHGRQLRFTPTTVSSAWLWPGGARQDAAGQAGPSEQLARRATGCQQLACLPSAPTPAIIHPLPAGRPQYTVVPGTQCLYEGQDDQGRWRLVSVCPLELNSNFGFIDPKPPTDPT